MRISELSKHKYSLIARIIFWAQKRKYGQILAPSKLWGRSPKLLYGLQAFYRAIDRQDSPIEPALRTLISVKISQINHCAFCMDIGMAMMQKRHVPMEKIEALANENSPLLTEREKVALAYATAVTVQSNNVSDELFQRLKKHFNDDAIIELTAVIAFQNLSSKFNSALNVSAQGFCRLEAGSRTPTN